MLRTFPYLSPTRLFLVEIGIIRRAILNDTRWSRFVIRRYIRVRANERRDLRANAAEMSTDNGTLSAAGTPEYVR